ncbi:hypothetical protein HFO98_10385 [Rhizobium leguminosarum]|uniref:hypothetical protein n=1 Tax=Rhizobium leguminosarum TaxID=384 RepID=UPI001C93BDC7|nr:hypothetical protein [Rhizobium leguminosarum]MBY5408877.1 hypothetical protein [Rhizobium leguminosarum]
MASDSGIIDKNDVMLICRMASTGRPPDGKIYIYNDKATKGLSLRAQGSKASWVVKHGGSDSSITIAYAHPETELRYMSALSKVQELASVIRMMLETGDKDIVKDFLSAYHMRRVEIEKSKGKDNNLARSLLPEFKSNKVAEAAALASEIADNVWSFGRCVTEAITVKSAPNAANKISIRGKTKRDMELTFNRPAFAEVLKKKVTEVTKRDIEAVRDDVFKTVGKGPSSAMKVVAYTKSVLGYCAGYASQSGLSDVDHWWELLKNPYQIEARERQPSIKDIVKTLVLAERYLDQSLPGRVFGDAGVGHGALAALWWIVLTAQRVDAGLSLRPFNVVEDQERPGSGWLLAGWDGVEMKAGKSFVLPIPARAWSFIEQFRQQGKNIKDSDWAFPSDKKAGVHVSQSGVYRILYRLAGKDALVQPKRRKEGARRYTVPARGGRCDLLEENGIQWWSGHDVRRTLGAEMTNRRMPGGASAILAHEVNDDSRLKFSETARKRLDFQKERAAKITAVAYGAESQFIELKSLAMTEWTNAVLDEYDRQAGRNVIPFVEAAE